MTESTTKPSPGGMLEEWTSYFFPSPSKTPLPSHVTCLEFFQRPMTNTTLLFQAVPHRFGVFDATTMALVGQEHPLSSPVRAARFLDTYPDKLLPDVLLLSTRLVIYSLERETVVQEIVGPIAAKDVLDVRVNDHVLAVLSPRLIHLFDRKQKYALQGLRRFRSLGLTLSSATIATTADAMALGPRWLAYPSILEERIANGFASSSSATFTAREDYSLSNVAHGVASSLYFLSQVGRKARSASSDDGKDVGSVAVHDVVTGTKLVQFKAHDSPITTLTFDPSGLLLVTSSKKGQTLHVHRLLGEDHVLLYKLQRGITYARIHHVCISSDAKWVAVTSLRGTTHVYAISPQGGLVDGHSHADVDYDDPAQLAASKAVVALEQQARNLGRPSWTTEKIQPLVRLRHTPAAPPTLQYDDDDLPTLHLQCQWAPAHTLYVAYAGALKTMRLLPKLAVDGTGAFSLSADLALVQDVDLEHQATHPTAPLQVTLPAAITDGVEFKTHHRPSLPLWVHPKVTFHAVSRSTGCARQLNVRRLGPIPLPTDAADAVHERVTQGESPVFDGVSRTKKPPPVPTLDLAASISSAVQSSVEIRPKDASSLDSTVHGERAMHRASADSAAVALDMTHIQDTYFASPPLAPLDVPPVLHIDVLRPVASPEKATPEAPPVEPFEELSMSTPEETGHATASPPRAKKERRKKQH
ncbi:hypothetical protein ACHHYP_05144 [Achlya hypogyna]|uniref:BCAS3 WD40 domain-containing protein n=1 Tax=Achlya hypogyna TaxID=1202772 RepID=A0A1V9YYY4_ACHHY|nr:hypothetical protein ACHHYP_05144 [Achlya hypogyna]